MSDNNKDANMSVVAAVMCGGRGTRMRSETEKPLMEIEGIHFIDRIVLALKKSDRFERIIGVVSPSTPATKKFLVSKRIETIDTPGFGYPHDLSILLEKLASARVFVLPADLPLLTAEIVREIVDKLEAAVGCDISSINENHDGDGGGSSSSSSGRKSRGVVQAASIVVEKSFAEELGITPSVVLFGGRLCHSGITLFDTQRIPVIKEETSSSKEEEKEIVPLEERYIIMNRKEVAINVNTKREKKLAESLVKSANDLAGDERL
jgi:GTP:adenosylcobinamide-phosphate guanylyltransferase